MGLLCHPRVKTPGSQTLQKSSIKLVENDSQTSPLQVLIQSVWAEITMGDFFFFAMSVIFPSGNSRHIPIRRTHRVLLMGFIYLCMYLFNWNDVAGR